MQRAIAALEDEYRTVLMLREIDGCSYETIAEILDLPVGTVRSRLHRPRLRLRATQSVDAMKNCRNTNAERYRTAN